MDQRSKDEAERRQADENLGPEDLRLRRHVIGKRGDHDM
jgi:hypothetical protein